jgi:hypothetical protein
MASGRCSTSTVINVGSSCATVTFTDLVALLAKAIAATENQSSDAPTVSGRTPASHFVAALRNYTRMPKSTRAAVSCTGSIRTRGEL